MSAPAERFPMRWPGRWRDPALLKVLEGTPIDFLLLPPDSGLARVRAEAEKRGLACRELVPAGQGAEPDRQMRRVARSELDWDTRDPVIAASECVWPSIASESPGSAGPTGVPWVDSNGWFAQLARTMLPGREIWLMFDPPAKTVLRPESYALAVADSETYGARWVISLDEEAEAEAGRAARVLKTVSAALRFFQQHRGWINYAPRAVLGVLSDFSGEHRHMAEEILNLAARRHLPFRVLDKRVAEKLDLAGLKAIVYPDAQPPARSLEERLVAFVRQGGLLVAGPGWRVRAGRSGGEDVHRRFEVLLVGKGRLAIAREAFSDPYLVALDAHLLLGRRHDLIRLWNGGSLNAHYTAEAGGKRGLVQLLNYATRRAAHEVTLGLSTRYRRAWFRELGEEKARPLEIVRAPHGIELPLPEFAVYAAIELEG